jgi:hypothetical protein
MSGAALFHASAEMSMSRLEKLSHRTMALLNDCI